jgi:outer membrane receptor protein involved in Fe transport
VPAPPGLPVPAGTPIQVRVSGACVGGGFYPTDGTGAPGTAFENTGTSQPKVDLRVDQDFTNGGRMSYSAGYAGTEGIVHTGIGPFDLQSGSYMGYGRIGYSKGALKIAAFANFLDAEAPNLLLTDPATLRPVELNFKTQTFDFEIGHSKVLAGKHILSYGGNARRNNFDITLASTAEDRTELGAYFQWEYFADKFRVVAGGRVDKFGNIDDPVFSPRVSLMFKPAQSHTLRVSYNRAFRSPSAINNFLEQRIFAPGVAPIDLRPLIPLLSVVAPPLVPLVPAQPVRLTVRNVGNEIGSTSGTTTLKEESLTAYEVSYTGTIGGRTTVGVALYQNDSDDNINFTNVIPSATFPTGIVPPFDVYSAANSAEIGIPGPLYAFLVQARIPGFPLPRTVTTYLNLGPLRQRGIELSLDHRINDIFTASANYSFQDDPEVLDPDSDQIRYPIEELALPAKNRFNVNLGWNSRRFLGSAGLNYSDEAFWSDVLSSPFHGFTDSYTMVNATFGVKWGEEGRLVTSLKGINLLNEAIQQHVFGDIIKRTLSFELRYNF